MTNQDDSAFPAEFGWTKGLTKREYFAVMAMQGMLANSHEKRQYPDLDIYAIKARVVADDLIAELNK